jgi:hypothetical protein
MKSFQHRWKIAFKEAVLPPSVKAVGAWLCLYYMDWNDGGSMYPGNPRLARELNKSVSTIYRALKRLQADGWLIQSRRGHSGSASVFRATFPSQVTPVSEHAHKRAPLQHVADKATTLHVVAEAPSVEYEGPRAVQSRRSWATPDSEFDDSGYTAKQGPGAYIFTTGKYAGQSIADVYSEDWRFITWCIAELKNKSVRDKCAAYFTEQAWQCQPRQLEYA